MGKKRIIKKFEQLPEEIIERIREKYPDGFEDYLITFTNLHGEIELGLPFETDDVYYLVKMPKDHHSSEDDETENVTYGGFDNFENLEIAEEVERDSEGAEDEEDDTVAKDIANDLDDEDMDDTIADDLDENDSDD